MAAKKLDIAILGDGRIAQAAAWYLGQSTLVGRISVFASGRPTYRPDLLIGALPGGLGERCLEQALHYRTHLIDISDVDPPYYLANKKKIERSGITVIPGCGFSPGLVNLILGRELALAGRPRRITVKAGSLSRRRHFFPFLWCFEDLVLEHRIDSWQLVAGKKVRYPPFAGYQRERFFGIEAESYLSASGFENLLEKSKVRDFTCRVVRPLGFEVFFRFLQNQGFLDGHNACSTKQIVESHREDNITMAEIVVEKGGSGTEWLLKSFSRRQGRLNSMQKITAIVPATIGICLLQGRIRRKGLVFMEDIGSDQGIFSVFERTLRNNGILMQRRKRRA